MNTVFLLTTSNHYIAAVIAHDDAEARLLALTHEPRGWWHTASAAKIAECRATRTRRVLAMDRPKGAW
jgi:hypothetical protein